MEVLPYQSQTLLEVAYNALKSDIARNVLKQGQKINIKDLSERYGISETPLKQALNRLVSEELVVSIPRKGMRVREVKFEEIAELFEIRYMFETFFIQKILSHIRKNPPVLGEFRAILKEHENTIKKVSDIKEYYKNYAVDKKFHQLYMRCVENRVVEKQYNSLRIHGYIDYVYQKQEMGQMVTGMEEHKLIYMDLEAQDAQALAKDIKKHIENVKIRIYKILIEAG
jgi:DNA-binding GntR family transcriptional regulator